LIMARETHCGSYRNLMLGYIYIYIRRFVCQVKEWW
jgi:hypothetical protein